MISLILNQHIDKERGYSENGGITHLMDDDESSAVKESILRINDVM